MRITKECPDVTRVPGNSRTPAGPLSLIIAAFLLFSFFGAKAQDPDPGFDDYLASVRALLPVEGTLLYDCSRLSGYHFGTQLSNTMELLDVGDEGLPFTRSYRITVSETSSSWWQTYLTTPANTDAIQQGDMLFWVFYARTIEVQQEEALAKVFFQSKLAEHPWPVVVQTDVFPRTGWTRFYVYGESPADCGPGKIQASIFFEFVQQTIDIGGFIALNLGQGIDPADLPKNLDQVKFEDYLASVRELLPVEGTLLYDCSRLNGYQFSTYGTNTISLFNVEDDEVPFTQAYRANVTELSDYWWNTQIITPANTSAVQQGDMLFWVFYARTNEVHEHIGLAKITFKAQIAEPPWPAIIQTDVYPDTGWTRFYVYSEAPADYEPGKLEACFFLEFFQQSVEIGGFIALNLGQGIDPATLPANMAMINPGFDNYLASVRELLPVDGTLLFDCSDLSRYRYYGNLPDNTFSMINTENDDVPFGKAFRVNTSSFTPGIYEQVILPKNEVPVQWGDMVFIVFYARSVIPQQETGMAMHAGCGTSTSTSREISSLTLRPPEYEWTPYYFFGRAHHVYDIGELITFIHFSHSPQTIDIGGFIALNLGQGIDPLDLPYTVTTYDGREEDAPWRQAAEQRIEEHRKGDLLVQVIDESGNPVSNADVSVEMKRHAFQFGTSPAWNFYLWTETNGINYREKLLSLFNAATTGFFMGTDDYGWYVQPDYRTGAIAMAAWLQENNITAKGHVLIWPGWNNMPSLFRNLADDPEAFRTAFIHHLDTVIPIGRDLGIAYWDVINEPASNHDVMDILGDEVIIEWFEHTHALHPEAELAINEAGILSGYGSAVVQNNLERLVGILQDADAPIHRIGFQSHMGSYLTSPDAIFEILERFSLLGLKMQISEFDINIDDELAQADYIRDFMTIIFSHPSVDKFTTWGFWEPTMFVPKGAMFRTDWSEKPNYFAYTDLVFNQWWTTEEGIVNDQGEFQVRGFLGDYEITASRNGISSTQEAALINDGTTVTIVLADPTFTITATAGNRGQIEPAGEIVITRGSDQAFHMIPDEGCHIDKIFVDAEEINMETDTNWDANQRIYTFSNITKDHSIHAEFALNTYTLVYAAGENGFLRGEPEQIVEHGADGTEVEAIPDEGYHFTEWSDGVSTAKRTDTNVTENISVTALFAINEYTLTYEAGDHGSITGEATQTIEHGADGTEVEAIPDEGYHFVEWSDGVSTAKRTDTNVTENISVTASFSINEYTLTYEAGNHGSITGEATQTVEHGADGSEVEAIPDEGYHFTEWSDGVNTAKRTDTNVTENISVTASFSINVYTVAASVNNEAYGTITGAGTYEHGETVTLTAASSNATNFIFSNWTEEGSQVHDQPAYTFEATADRTLVANFRNVTAVALRDEIKGIKVYPIPTGDILIIESETMLEQIRLLDLLGKVHYSEKVNQMSYALNVSHLQDGIYLLIAISPGGISAHRVQIAK